MTEEERKELGRVLRRVNVYGVGVIVLLGLLMIL